MKTIIYADKEHSDKNLNMHYDSILSIDREAVHTSSLKLAAAYMNSGRFDAIVILSNKHLQVMSALFENKMDIDGNVIRERLCKKAPKVVVFEGYVGNTIEETTRIAWLCNDIGCASVVFNILDTDAKKHILEVYQHTYRPSISVTSGSQSQMKTAIDIFGEEISFTSPIDYMAEENDDKHWSKSNAETTSGIGISSEGNVDLIVEDTHFGFIFDDEEGALVMFDNSRVCNDFNIREKRKSLNLFYSVLRHALSEEPTVTLEKLYANGYGIERSLKVNAIIDRAIIHHRISDL